MPDVEAVARALYESATSVRPAWGQLGDVTRDVWRAHAVRFLALLPLDDDDEPLA